MDVYDRIDKVLEKKHISRRKLALLAGVPPTTLQSAFSRKTEKLSFDTIKKIADALGVPVADLAGWSAFDDQYPHLADEVKLLDLAKKIDENIFQLNELFLQLNDSGKAKAIDALSDLVMIEKYTKEK